MVPCNHDHVCCCRPAHAGRLACSRFTKEDRKSTRLNSSHSQISYAVFCLKKKKVTDGSYPGDSKAHATPVLIVAATSSRAGGTQTQVVRDTAICTTVCSRVGVLVVTLVGD